MISRKTKNIFSDILSVLMSLYFLLAPFCLSVSAEETIKAEIPVYSNTKTTVKIDAVTKNAPLPANTQIVLDNNNFSNTIAINYSTTGVYEYNVYQLKSEDKNIIIDETVYRIEVYVMVDSNNKMYLSIVAKNNKTGEKPDKIYFNNKKTENKEECVGCTIDKPGRTITEAPTGVEKNDSFYFYILLGIGIANFIFLKFIKLDNKKKFLYIFPSLVIIVSLVGISLPVIEYEKQSANTQNEIQLFLDETIERNNTPENNEEPSETVSADYDENIKGIIEIDSINLKAPIADNTDRDTLTKYVGKYSELEDFGEVSGVVGLAAHSTRFAEPCPYCYFQNIGELQDGDIIKITWNDGKIYQYVVFDVQEWQNENTPGEFEPIENKEILILQTCTNGQRGTRTYVHAERKV